MKKIKLCILSLSLLFAFILVGCGNANGNREAELEEKITQLEQQIATLEAEKTANVSVGEFNTTKNINQNGEVSATASGSVTTDERKDVSADTVESLTKEVDKVVKKIDAATPSKDKEKKETVFFQLKEELDIVEDRIDAYEDCVESQYRQGSISYEDYKKKEQQLEVLENKLDKWEDKLESSFRLDD